MSLRDLPTLNALLNALSAVLLILGVRRIRARDARAHKRLMTGAFLVSTLFLASYLFYHFQVGSVGFAGAGWVRPIYFFILITHSVLAAFVPPMAILTLYRAWRGDFARHRRIARWTYPVWLYVSVTGVMVYWFLYVLYPAP